MHVGSASPVKVRLPLGLGAMHKWKQDRQRAERGLLFWREQVAQVAGNTRTADVPVVNR